MNREIKFRAWDKKTEKMIAVGYHVIGETTMFNMIEEYLFEHKDEGQGTIERFIDVVEMQYTGLKDKNGKEIYEGDVLQSLYGVRQYKVEFKNGTFVTESGMFCLNRSLWGKCEIIGNIYEHPEFSNPLTSKQNYMSTEANDPVTPLYETEYKMGMAVNVCANPGMTLRQYFAAMAMQGILANGSGWSTRQCNDAVDAADALIEALNNSKQSS